jgi:hypothetical protein
MKLYINGQEIAAYPAPGGFTVTIMDLDDADATTRTSDGTLNRARVAVKRQIDMTFPTLTNEQISGVLKAMQDVFFDFTYPDPMEGAVVTKQFYVGNRPAAIPFERDGMIMWEGLQITLTER